MWQAQGIDVMKAADLRASMRHMPMEAAAALTPVPVRKKSKTAKAAQRAAYQAGEEQAAHGGEQQQQQMQAA